LNGSKFFLIFLSIFSQSLLAQNLKDFENKEIKRDLEKILKCQVILENDAVLGGLGEAYFGSGKNLFTFCYLTFGTGIGGVKIFKGRVAENIFGFEPGHSYLIFKNNFLEVEKILGGKNIERKFKNKTEIIKDKNFWNKYYDILSIFLVNVAIFWSVDKIIIGGGLINIFDFRKLNYFVNQKFPLPIKIKIIKSRLKDKRALYGGLAYCTKRVKF
ncbi:MAG: ROK family protein, partial [Patescibacteria group bacterium]|nr:ROK family protein [Patescibacteria group bacterium]